MCVLLYLCYLIISTLKKTFQEPGKILMSDMLVIVLISFEIYMGVWGDMGKVFAPSFAISFPLYFLKISNKTARMGVNRKIILLVFKGSCRIKYMDIRICLPDFNAGHSDCCILISVYSCPLSANSSLIVSPLARTSKYVNL